ncbi:MAG: aspartate carbamoyltransferase regulatory subunit [Bacteroidales bacterium]|jgi:aspartate carbamoyltransferase regulatory subunit|nr:aspartate carbamoyltransferase regulatory subunit [Bacteroidales bacterium]MDI9544453.1 aspartate carbamoyltransferase regulatory subunit [Bacteroidota bacterium]OQC02098.1 MAG: Aspartate carbamoyltransferase regulatory chain [Bacteroidetes bacterium ADurb.Bin090]MBP8982408.1 aspartate carbamoyltransferase regulatory subunit [Bacteroidales bacterium]HNZ80327.1 aspartate carbamoyltransferase regulatory subunit [Bacteroidales bacterium]
MDKKYVKKEMQVKALENGTVIDHIPANKLFKVVEILQLEQISNEVTIGNNLASKRMGTKGIIKVANRFFESKEINRIALIAPNAKINIIRDYQVTEKRIITLPDHFKGIVKCVNPKCITNNEVMEPRYNVISKSPLVLKCPYCEREIREEELQLL